MKSAIKPAILIALTAVAAPALADVGVSVSVSQPGIYGQINIGDTQPQVIYQQPVVVQAPPGPPAPPIYLHVPPGYEKHWRHHCAEYNACGQRVLFVHENWYRNVYVPQHVHDHDGDHREWHGEDRHDDHWDHDHGHDHDHDHDRGDH